jgi:hypothetical protein
MPCLAGRMEHNEFLDLDIYFFFHPVIPALYASPQTTLVFVL